MKIFCFSFFIWQTFLTAYKKEDKATERKFLKMLLKTYFSRIQGYIYSHVVAVMSLYLNVFGIHYNAFQNQLQHFNRVSQVSKSMSFYEKQLWVLKWFFFFFFFFFRFFFLSYVFIYYRGKMRHEFIFSFYQKNVLHAIFLLTQESPFILAYSGKFHCHTVVEAYFDKDTHLRWSHNYLLYDYRSSVCMLVSDDAFTE